MRPVRRNCGTRSAAHRTPGPAPGRAHARAQQTIFAALGRCRRIRREHWWQMHGFDTLANELDGSAEVGAFKARGDHYEALQILAADFILRRQLRDGGHGAKRGRCGPELELKTVSSMLSRDWRDPSPRRTRIVYGLPLFDQRIGTSTPSRIEVASSATSCVGETERVLSAD